MKKPTLKELKAALLDAAKYELDKIYVQAKTRYVEQKEKVHLTKDRGILIDLASKQLTFLFVA